MKRRPESTEGEWARLFPGGAIAEAVTLFRRRRDGARSVALLRAAADQMRNICGADQAWCNRSVVNEFLLRVDQLDDGDLLRAAMALTQEHFPTIN
jgi:hypothetical protein